MNILGGKENYGFVHDVCNDLGYSICFSPIPPTQMVSKKKPSIIQPYSQHQEGIEPAHRKGATVSKKFLSAPNMRELNIFLAITRNMTSTVFCSRKFVRQFYYALNNGAKTNTRVNS